MTHLSQTAAVEPDLKGRANFSFWRGAVLLALVLIAPMLFMEGYQLFQVSMVCSYALALLGLNLLTGWTGQISVGHGAFLALGAYVAALAMSRLGVPYWAALPLAAVICFVAGFLFGIPALRFEGHYLALLTFVLAICVPQLVRAKAFESITGGVGGIVLSKPRPPAWLRIDDDLFLYCLSCVVLIVAFWFAYNLGRGRIGRSLLAIREQPTAAATMGVNVALYKSIVFGISAGFAGAGGALSAVLVQYVSPDSFSIFLSVSLLVGVVVGGLGAVSGAIYGALFIQYVPIFAENISKSIPWAVYGALLICVVFFAPDGIAGVLRSASSRVGSFARRIAGRD